MSRERSVRSDVPEGPKLRSVLFNICISDVDDGIKRTLRNFVDDTQMSAVYMEFTRKKCHPE